MRRRKALWSAILTGAILALGAYAVVHVLRPKPGPFRVAVWYWHSPFQISAEDRKTLKALGVDTLFVRAGTFTVGDEVTMMMPQTWRGKSDGLTVHLVFPFDAGMIRHFDELKVADIAPQAAKWIQRSASRAETAGVHVAGIQLDFDCPTRLLPKYADVVRQTRALLKRRKWKWSVTALPTWLRSDGIVLLARQVDFIVPQYYEGAVGRRLADLKPIAEPATIEAGMDRASRVADKFWVGLACYGRAFMFDEHERLLGTYRGLSVRDALRHPSFQFERGYSSVEDVVVLKAVRPAANGRGMGYRLVYLLPTLPTLTKQIETVRRDRPANCQGIVLFRYPEPGESMCLPFASIAAALNRQPPQPIVETRFSSKPDPWGLIDTGREADPSSDVAFTLELRGNTPTAASGDALVVALSLDRAGIDSLEPGDFDVAEAGHIAPDGSFERAGLARATAVRFVRFHMLPGETAKLGALETAADGATSIWGEWHLKAAGGAGEFHGEIVRRNLRTKGGRS